MSQFNTVYLTGFMGCGKTTAGKKLASCLNWSFIDLDRKIEEAGGKTIPELFEEYGENYFRGLESEVLRNTVPEENTIISTGGGTPCFDDNMDFMTENGLTVYLKLTPLQLRSRLSDSKADRPLIRGLSNDELLHFIEEKLAIREKWYNRSEIIIEGFNFDVNIMQGLIKSRLYI